MNYIEEQERDRYSLHLRFMRPAIRERELKEQTMTDAVHEAGSLFGPLVNQRKTILGV